MIDKKYKKIEISFYDKFWKNLKGRFSFDKTHFSSEVPDKELLDFIKILKKNKVHKKVLDIGCGNARNAVLMSKNNFNLSGIDFSQEAIKLSKMNSKLNNVKIDFRVGNFLEKNYQNNQFQACIDSGLFHHLRQYQRNKYLNILNKILAPKGYLYLKVFSVSSGKMHKFTPPAGRSWIKKNNHYSYLFSQEEIKKIFQKDFKIIKIIKSQKGETPLKFLIFIMQKIS